MTGIKKIISGRNQLLIYLFLVIIFNTILTNFPLTNVFGFEFSVLNSVLLVILSGLYTLSLLQSEKQYKTFLNKSLISFCYFLIIPAVISITNDLLTISCSILDGVLFYSFITIPSVVIGSALALLSVFVSNKFRFLIFFSLFFFIITITFFEFYYNPQIYFYNPIYAYFPGTIYDEAIKVDAKLMIYRSLNFLFFGLIYFVASLVFYKRTIVTKKLVIYIVLLISTLFLYLSPDFGFSTTQNKLKKILGNRVTTRHFDIYFSPDINKDLVKITALHHEYYYLQLERFYQLKPKEKYISFIFKSADQKKKFFGSENADVAKPWLDETFIVVDNYNTSLRHEIAHCFAGEFGWSIFKVAKNFNPALIEGAAVAGAPEYDLNDVHYMASLAYNNGYKVNLNYLFKTFNFFGQTSGLSYIYAGSFCKYLIDTYGITKFKKFYSTIDFQEVYNKNLNVLSKEYYSFILSAYQVNNQDQADYYFGRKPIIYKTCPRYVADRLREAWEYYGEEDYNTALQLYKKILQLTNNYSALIGYTNSLYKTGRENEAINFLHSRLNSFKNSSYYYNIEFRLADLCAEQQDTVCADTLYKNLISENPNRTLFYLSNLRESLLAGDSLIVPYLKGNDFDKYLILTSLNKGRYNYFSFPVIADLAQSLGENYDLFLNLFNKTLVVSNYSSAFALFRLSGYMLAHLDFYRARKIAALSTRYNKDNNFNVILNENYYKAEWFYENGNKLLSSINLK